MNGHTHINAAYNELIVTFNQNLMPTMLNSMNKTITKSKALSYHNSIVPKVLGTSQRHRNMSVAISNDKSSSCHGVVNMAVKIEFDPVMRRWFPFDGDVAWNFTRKMGVMTPIIQSNKTSIIEHSCTMKRNIKKNTIVRSLPFASI